MTRDTNMDDFEKIMQDPDVKAELRNKQHISYEMIMAAARGVLSPDGKQRVMSHVEACSQCAHIMELAQKNVSELPEADSPQYVNKQNIAAKAKLVGLINAKKDPLALEIAKVFIVKDQQFIINSVIRMIRTQIMTDDVFSSSESSEQLRAAAFTMGESTDNTVVYDIILRAVQCSDVLCEHLLDRCRDIDNVAGQIAQAVEHAIILLNPMLEGDKADKVMQAVQDAFKHDHEKQ